MHACVCGRGGDGWLGVCLRAYHGVGVACGSVRCEGGEDVALQRHDNCKTCNGVACNRTGVRRWEPLGAQCMWAAVSGDEIC